MVQDSLNVLNELMGTLQFLCLQALLSGLVDDYITHTCADSFLCCLQGHGPNDGEDKNTLGSHLNLNLCQ